MKTVLIDKQVALADLGSFVNANVKRPVGVEDLEKTYPDILDAIMDGFLTFNDGAPIYKLKNPIKTDEGNVSVAELSFLTRIHPSTLASLAKGLHPQHEVFALQLKMTAYIIGQPTAFLDKLSKYDYEAVVSISSVFS